ncbi:MAG: hypothetical protein U9Q30_08110 [Campylobacterota bacterium]|nr:hypothetical protein [Campylobacterota bacterium]
MIKEFTISKEELKKLFKKKELLDTNNGWYYKDTEVEIIALHDKELKYIQDVFNANYYKIREKLT